MYAVVIAACVLVSATDAAPKHNSCEMVVSKEKFFDTLKECDVNRLLIAKTLQKGGKIQVTDSKCVSSDLIQNKPNNSEPTPPAPVPAPPPVNDVNPKLKPLTSEQKLQGFQSL